MLESTLGSHVNIVVELASDLWPVYVDPSQLEVAVLNLALNARDAMAEKSGGVLTLRTYNIRLDAAPERAPGDYVCVEVRDTGDGMTQDVLSRIFEPFFTTKKLGQGTGLGLPQVHGFIKQSDGDIEVKSVLGDGTLIFLYLPRTHAESSRAGENLPLTQGATLSHGSCKTVLVVEDNADVSRTTTILLEHLGYKTLCAMSVAEALEILQTKTAAIDVVLSDVAMPGMNGIELARVLRLRHPSLPVVLATGYSELLTRWPEDISTDILRKPYQLEHLAAALERAFARVDATS
jgi:CheY-like chemotaxis protein